MPGVDLKGMLRSLKSPFIRVSPIGLIQPLPYISMMTEGLKSSKAGERLSLCGEFRETVCAVQNFIGEVNERIGYVQAVIRRLHIYPAR